MDLLSFKNVITFLLLLLFFFLVLGNGVLLSEITGENNKSTEDYIQMCHLKNVMSK